MAAKVSPRILRFVDALPLAPGMRVLEVGCGPGVAAREVCRRIGDGYVLAIDRSEKAIALAVAGSASEIAAGRLNFEHRAAEDLVISSGTVPFDIAFAMRVDSLDGRHPESGELVRMRLRSVLKPGGRLFVDTGDPLKEIDLTHRT